MDPLLRVEDLDIEFQKEDTYLQKTNKVHFTIEPGEIVCVVGESGCGKSITAMSILGILPGNANVKNGKIIFQGKNLLRMSQKELDDIRGKEISMIFQDVMNSLNPVLTIGFQMCETIQKHLGYSKKKAKEYAISLLEQVGLKDASGIMKKFPHVLSGGMIQRVMIAMALANHPSLLIADEPTTALDVTIQLQIMSLLKELQQKYHMAILFITHDMGVVAELADKVVVMYAGECVEESEVNELFEHPKHPYTNALLESIPRLESGLNKPLSTIPGSIPTDYGNIKGCRFYERCSYANAQCTNQVKMTRFLNGHQVLCTRFYDKEQTV